MATTDLPPRFFTLFLSQFSSDSLLIPIAYYDHLPRLLPKTMILQRPCGRSWDVGMKTVRDEVYFDQGWPKFVEDNKLSDGCFMTFVYNGDRIFEVSIYDHNGDKEVEEDKEDCVVSLNSQDSDTCSKSEIPETSNKGKKQKKVVESSDEDSDYTEAFGVLGFEEDSNSSYAPDDENKVTCVKPNETNLKKKQVAPPKIENPETYLDDPKNIHFETYVKNRTSELCVSKQVVKDYCLRFEDYVDYMDGCGTLRAKTAKWKDERVSIKKWMNICRRNKLKKDDRILCELLRRGDVVYAIKLHIIRGADL